MPLRTLICIPIFVAVFAAGVPVFAQETDPAAGTADSGGMPSQLYAKLQVPLPFVATDCFITDAKGKPVLDEQSKPIPAVCNLSDYIAGVYRLLIGLAATFAVVMLIIAGYQWIFSGGGSDKIGAAKKRIFGAAIGLMLALLSYVILNAVTPRLVALRLPDVEPVQTIGFSEQDGCNDPENTVVKQFCKDSANCLADISAPFPKFTRGLSDARCGSRYLVSSDLQTINGECGGDVCFDETGRPVRGVCLAGKCFESTYLYGSLVAEQAFSPTLHRRNVKSITVRQLCGNTPVTKAEKELSDHASWYVMQDSEADGTDLTDFIACAVGEHKGYILELEVNSGILGGLTDHHYFVGKDCTASLADFNEGMPSFEHVTPGQLIQAEDFERGYKCDLDTSNFPAYE